MPGGPAATFLDAWFMPEAGLPAPLRCFAALKRKEQGRSSQTFSSKYRMMTFYQDEIFKNEHSVLRQHFFMPFLL